MGVQSGAQSGAQALLPAGVRFLERDWLSSNQILCIDDNQATLIDTAYCTHATLTTKLVEHTLATAGPEVRLTHIINTHLHSDHCGGNAALAGQWGCPISVPEACFDTALRWDDMTHHRLGQQCDRFTPDSAMAPGEQFEAGGVLWHAYAAPGHDPTSLIFFAPDAGVLISADALWEHGFGLIFPELDGESGFAEQAAVLDLIESLNPVVIIPGHGPIFTDLKAALNEARSRLAALQSDPQRNYRLAMKVLIKFVMLDRQQISLQELHQASENADLLRLIAQGMQTDTHSGIDWAVAQLVGAGQLKRTGDQISNA